MRYEHTQHGPLHFILFLVGALMFAGGMFAFAKQPIVGWLLIGSAVLMVLFAFCFMNLTVRDEGDYLAVRFGVLPWFKKLVPWKDVESAEVSRSSLIDGWGIHRVPWRGSTFNLWGFACARLLVNGRVVRIGSDDAENLVAAIRRRISPGA